MNSDVIEAFRATNEKNEKLADYLFRKGVEPEDLTMEMLKNAEEELKMAQTANQTAVTTTQTAEAATVPQANMSERFMQKVIHEFSGSVGEFQITDYQRQLIQGYFIGVDRALKTAEAERIRKNERNNNHEYDNKVPVTWANVNMADLALDVVHYARLGLDTMQANFITPIPYLNNKTSLYDVNLMLGYNGIKYIAEKFALDPPRAVTIELVYQSDNFRPYKRGRGNDVEGYDFEITNPFDRGKIVGGFGYIEYSDARKNELVIMSMKDIEKRKPPYASPNFWGGGTRKEWQTVNGKRQQVEVEAEGWLDEMCRKTLIREVYSPKHILLDPRKVDENYQYMRQREEQLQRAQDDMQTIINVTANTTPIEEATARMDAPKPKVQEIPAAHAEPEPIPAAVTSRPQARAQTPVKQTPAEAAPAMEPAPPMESMSPPSPATQTAAAAPQSAGLYAGMDF